MGVMRYTFGYLTYFKFLTIYGNISIKSVKLICIYIYKNKNDN